jgi:hypothetical protein
MNVHLWLLPVQLTANFGEVVYRLEGAGVVVAQHPPAAGQDLLV